MRYRNRMRAVITLLLILLLPVQAWAALGMQVSMDVGTLQAGLHSSSPTDKPVLSGAMAAMPGDCPMLQLQQHAGHQEGVTTPSRDHCQSCELCMPLIEQVPMLVEAVAVPTWPPRFTLIQSFRTACLAGALEPPICA